MATYVEDDVISARVAGIYRQAQAQMPAEVPNVISDHNQAAYDIILEKLLGRGFTQAQIDAWARREEFNREIAKYKVLVSLGDLQADAIAAWVEALDKIFEDLDTVDLVVDGDVAIPTVEGAVGYGTFSTTADITAFEIEQITNW